MQFSTQTDVSFKRFGIEKGLEVLAKAGFKTLDLSMFCKDESGLFSDSDIELIKKTAERLGLTFSQAHAPFGVDIFMTELLPLMPRIFKYCKILGIPHIVVHPIHFERLRYYGHEKELFDRNVELFKLLAPMAKENGVKIAIENMWTRNPSSNQIVDGLCADPYEMIAMYDTLNDPEAFTLLLDVGHVALTNREPEDSIRIIGREKLGGLHVHDVDYVGDLHTLPGFGKINWEEVCRALGEIDYKGVFTLEADNFFRKIEDDFFEVGLRFMKDRVEYLAKKVDSYRK